MSLIELDKKYASLDLVFLVDASRSMSSSIDALVSKISTFIDALNGGYGNSRLLIADWRMRLVGYRDRDCNGVQWLVDNLFSTDAGEIKSQSTSLEAVGGGNDPTSLLDAMYQVSQWVTAEKGLPPAANGWRHHHDAARGVIIFTDASCKNTFTSNDGSEGTVDDLIHAYHSAKLEVTLLAPEAPVYVDLSAMNGLAWEPVGVIGGNSNQVMADFIKDTDAFNKIIESFVSRLSRAKAIY